MSENRRNRLERRFAQKLSRHPRLARKAALRAHPASR
jgi:hypothetical protein